MKAGCCGIGIFSVVVNAFRKVFDVLITVIVYLGLYFPMFYGIVVLGLWLWGGMTFEPSTETALFYVGLVLSIVCSILVTLRHLIFEPFGRFLDRREEKRMEREYEEKQRRAKRKKKRQLEEDRRRRPVYRGEKREPPPHSRTYDNEYRRMRQDIRGERPYVYRSERDRSLVIYEFSDRFEVYREGERGLRYIDTKWKR